MAVGKWGETPVAFVVLKPDAAGAADAGVRAEGMDGNSRFGKTRASPPSRSSTTLPAQRPSARC